MTDADEARVKEARKTAQATIACAQRELHRSGPSPFRDWRGCAERLARLVLSLTQSESSQSRAP